MEINHAENQHLRSCLKSRYRYIYTYMLTV